MLLIALFRYVIVIKLMASRIILIKYVVLLVERIAWKQYHTFRTQELLAKYKSIASKCRSTIYSQHVDVENKVINSDNVNKFCRYANSKFTNKSPIGPLKSNDGSKSYLVQSCATNPLWHFYACLIYLTFIFL